MHRHPESSLGGGVASQVDVALVAAAIGDPSKNVDEVLVRAAAVDSFRRSAGIACDWQLWGRTH